MWRPSSKSSVKIHKTYSPTASFKDIHHLCKDNDSSSSPSLSRVFRRVCAANLILRSWPTRPPSNHLLLRADSEPVVTLRRNHEPDAIRISIPGAESSIVVYFTSLRVVRPTFEDCRAVTAILRAFPVRVDERDHSMDASFAAELERIFAGEKDLPTKLPRVFIGGRYVGGAEEVKRLHEIGELKKLVRELPRVEPDRHKPLGLEEIHKAQEEKRGPDIIDSVSKNRASTGRSSTEELLTKTTKPALVQNRYDALSSQCDD